MLANELDVADTNRGWESDDDDCCSTGSALPVVRSGHRATWPPVWRMAERPDNTSCTPPDPGALTHALGNVSGLVGIPPITFTFLLEIVSTNRSAPLRVASNTSR